MVVHRDVGMRSVRDFKNLKSGGNVVLNTCNNNDNSSGDDYPDAMFLECSGKQSLSC